MTVHSFQEARIAREQAAMKTGSQSLKDGDGGGTSGGMTNSSALDGRITRLEGAAVAAFIFLIVTFGGGYVLLSNQMASGFDRVGGKLDVMSRDIGKTQSDIAVLEERSKN